MTRHGTAAGSLTVALNQALDQVSQRVEEITVREGLSLQQWMVLRQLAERGDQAMGDLVRATRFNDSTLTRIVDRLATRGWIYREVDPTDRRRVRVSLSARGRALHQRLAPSVEERERALVDALACCPSLIESLAQLGDPDGAG